MPCDHRGGGKARFAAPARSTLPVGNFPVLSASGSDRLKLLRRIDCFVTTNISVKTAINRERPLCEHFSSFCFERVLRGEEAERFRGNLMSDFRSIRLLNSNRQWLVRLAVVALIGVTATQAGCNVLRAFDQTAALTFRDMVWSKRAFNLRYGNCDRPYAEHFKNGFCDGYSDTAQGGDGFTPALPPDTYRGYEFQSADGGKCVDAWFEGYPAGVAAARKDNSGSYHDLAVSRLLDAAIKQEKTKPKVSGAVPVVSGKKVVDQNGPRRSPVDYKAPPLPLRTAVPAFRRGMPSVISQDSNIEWETTPRVVPAGFEPELPSFEVNSPEQIRAATRWTE